MFQGRYGVVRLLLLVFTCFFFFSSGSVTEGADKALAMHVPT
jgi:hypothetical protein